MGELKEAQPGGSSGLIGAGENLCFAIEFIEYRGYIKQGFAYDVGGLVGKGPEHIVRHPDKGQHQIPLRIRGGGQYFARFKALLPGFRQYGVYPYRGILQIWPCFPVRGKKTVQIENIVLVSVVYKVSDFQSRHAHHPGSFAFFFLFSDNIGLAYPVIGAGGDGLNQI